MVGTEPPAASSTADNNVISLVDDDDEEVIQKSSWPESLPHPKADLVLSVVCGNSRLHWAVHTAEEHKFEAVLFWNSTPFADDQDTDVYKFFPQQFYDRLGCRELSKNPTLENFHKHFSKLRVPYFDVYLLSTNVEHAMNVPALFSHLPCRIHKLVATDFLSKDMIYETMGADRAASLKACKEASDSDNIEPMMVLDGGTAMTWTATNAKGVFQGGGIVPGVGVKFRSLHDRTGALPDIDHKTLISRIQKCEDEKKPLQIFGSNTQDQMLAGVLRETALNLSNVVCQWVAKIRKEVEAAAKEKGEEAVKQKLKVIVTGGDADTMMKLLAPHFSHIVEDDADHTAFMGSGEVEIVKLKFLGNRGVSYCLREKFASETDLSEIEKQRQDILGLRVVHPDFKTPRARGTVYDVQRSASLDTDKFKIQYDNGRKDVMGVETLYVCLKTYGSIGEPNNYGDMMGEERLARKKESRAAAESLVKSMPSLASEKEAEAWKKRSLDMVSEITSNKKAKTGNEDSSQVATSFETITLKTVKDNPRSFVKRRIAKYFDEDLYFGTVESYKGYWRVEYDDGDSEEYDAKDMVLHLKEYELHRNEDPEQNQ